MLIPALLFLIALTFCLARMSTRSDRRTRKYRDDHIDTDPPLGI